MFYSQQQEDITYQLIGINQEGLEKTYGLDIASKMESLLVDELTKSINQEILFDCISPETKGLSTAERQAAVEIIIKTAQRNNKIDDLIKD